ncbi:MAG: hypothetical protein JSW41_02085 [Candidatus Aenigmatarchaeota archaeon]|nr:MAG: hypothetical protein JSW41_02085 [Candidatus Aenigmarchaeota archaeon]
MTSITFYLTLAVVLVGGIISWGIMDALVVETLETTGVNLEAHTITGGSGSFNVNNVPLLVVSNVTNNAYNSSMTETANYTILDTVTGEINVTNYDANEGACCQVSYTYDDATYLSSSLSRTIVTYIVPIGLLGLLTLAVVMRRE